jgi:ketosteroid isomerase-like protein
MRLALFCLTVLLTACKPAEQADYAHEIRDVEAARLKTAAAKDVDAYVNYFADDASMLMPNAPLLTGKQPIKEELKPLMSDPNFSLSFLPNKLEVAKSGDLAFTQGPYKMTFSDIRGNKFEDEGKYLTVWRKLPGGTWKAVEDTFITDLPLPPPPN